MGNKQVNTDQIETNYIFNLLRAMSCNERTFKTFCFKFEYKFFKKTKTNSKTVKTTMDWEEFEKEMLNNYPDLETDPGHYLINNTFKNFFKLQGSEIRMFKIYVLYFPYVLHLDGIEFLNFVDFIYEKLMFNIETELNEKISTQEEDENKSATPPLPSKVKGPVDNENLNVELYRKNAEKFLRDEVSSKKSNKHINKSSTALKNDASSLRSSRKLLNDDKNKSSVFMKDMTRNIDAQYDEVSPIYDSETDNLLIRMYMLFFVSRGQNKSFVRFLPLKLFREIMYNYFQTNITNILVSFKETLRNFDPYKHDDDHLVKEIKKLKHQNINVEKLIPANVYKFIDSTITKLANKRINLPKFKDLTTLELTFDDIYLYIKINSFFLDSAKCYEEFNRLII